MSEPSLLPPSFLRYAIQAKIVKKAIAIAGGTKHSLVNVEDDSGKLQVIALNLEDKDDLVLVVEIDGKKIINHTIDHFNGTGATKLAISKTQTTGGVIDISTLSGTSNSIIFNFNQSPLPYQHSLHIYIENTSTAEYDIQAAYILYDIYKG